MNFISLEFAIFLPIVFALYWWITNKNLTLQNWLIVVVSYFFYGWWDWRFLLLIAFSTTLDFILGKKIHAQNSDKKRKNWLLISLFINLGFLGFFKYFNFFIDSFNSAFHVFGSSTGFSTLQIILPVGISFYTFQSLSYTIDIYRKRLKPTTDFGQFAAYVSFFPQLVAGPIERATHLLPQFSKKRTFDYESAADGMRLILWGLFKKMVVADNCAEISNQVFGAYQEQSGISLIIGAIAFSFQIYGDFSGYSDIAVGTSKLFGFKLMRNFHLPYLSRNLAEFWRRWHISLTSWFRDYVYFPLGGNRTGFSKTIRNTFVVFLVSGFWHGANFTFIAWGLFHALLFIPLLISGKNKITNEHIQPENFLHFFKIILQILTTYSLVTLGWIFFRSASITDAFSYFQKLFSFNDNYLNFNTIYNGNTAISNFSIVFGLVFSIVLIIAEWIQRNKNHVLEIANNKYRWPIYIFIISLIYICKGGSSAFIYFQF